MARRLLLLAPLVAAAFVGIGATFGPSPSAKSNVQTIYVRNVSTYVSDAAVRNALPAFNDAAHNDFAPLWHVDANLVYLGRKKAPVGASVITLVDKGPVPNALAYHELVNGVPDSVIYTGVSKFYGFSWTVGFTHELWEQLADPGIVRTMQSTGGSWPDGTIWANEIADPVESDADAYTRKGANGHDVLISDFVTEKWFGALTAGPFDFANHVQSPLVVDKGGYAQYWDGVNWVLVSNFRSARDRGFLNGEEAWGL